MNATVSVNTATFVSAIATLAQQSQTPEAAYYYHSDHLGGAAWITDGGGQPVQHLQYLPFGEPFVNQRVAGLSYNERYIFTGKERDSETGYSYFGARYYDSGIPNIFLSVDPMADKYPNISPYAYCAWNPIKLVDPCGMDTVFVNNEAREMFNTVFEKISKDIKWQEKKNRTTSDEYQL